MADLYEAGVVGLGVMGRNLLLNLADHGFSVAGYDRVAEQVSLLESEAGNRPVRAAHSVEEMVRVLEKPRVIIVLVPAGPPVDAVISTLLPRLEKGDIIMDGGNSYFRHTEARASRLSAEGISLLGVGISGGEKGARYGASIMPGGPKEAYDRVSNLLRSLAATVDGEPCMTYLGPRSAGHYVKMVHNGIEYGLMQLIAETYDIMKRGLGLSNEEIGQVYGSWDQAQLSSYLIEITARIFTVVDPSSGQHLVDMILDEAEQKGTGSWASQDGLELGVPMPTIDAAVAMRSMSASKAERDRACGVLGCLAKRIEHERAPFLNRLKNALFVAMMLTYAQGFGLLRAASQAYRFNLKLADVARIWRGGCIIRSKLLEGICNAFENQPDIWNIVTERSIAKDLTKREGDLRRIVETGARTQIPVPGLMISLAYLDAARSSWLPANLIQAQRDFFGSHRYRRVDTDGLFHTDWEEGQVVQKKES
jgi:6-phosphogluconate dehydrogenase